MAIEQEIKDITPLQKEFKNLLDQDFKNRKIKRKRNHQSNCNGDY